MSQEPTASLIDRAIAPSLVVRDVEKAIEFYKNALGAEVLFRGTRAQGTILYAQLRIGSSCLTLSEEVVVPAAEVERGFPDQLRGGISLEVFVDDVDAALERAVYAGGQPAASIRQAFYGDRVASFRDPFGHFWTLSTFLDDGGALCL